MLWIRPSFFYFLFFLLRFYKYHTIRTIPKLPFPNTWKMEIFQQILRFNFPLALYFSPSEIIYGKRLHTSLRESMKPARQKNERMGEVSSQEEFFIIPLFFVVLLSSFFLFLSFVIVFQPINVQEHF